MTSQPLHQRNHKAQIVTVRLNSVRLSSLLFFLTVQWHFARSTVVDPHCRRRYHVRRPPACFKCQPRIARTRLLSDRNVSFHVATQKDGTHLESFLGPRVNTIHAIVLSSIQCILLHSGYFHCNALGSEASSFILIRRTVVSRGCARRSQNTASKLPYSTALSFARSCPSSMCPGHLSTTSLVSVFLVVWSLNGDTIVFDAVNLPSP